MDSTGVEPKLGPAYYSSKGITQVYLKKSCMYVKGNIYIFTLHYVDSFNLNEYYTLKLLCSKIL
jgi:hypothetical protein